MSKVATIGADRIALKLELKGDKARARVHDMLNAGSKIVVDEAWKNATGFGLVQTGQLVQSIKPIRETITADSASIEITAAGTRTRGKRRERNATIGFVQEHGRSYGKTKREARPFFANAVSTVEPQIIDLWGRMANDE